MRRLPRFSSLRGLEVTRHGRPDLSLRLVRRAVARLFRLTIRRFFWVALVLALPSPAWSQAYSTEAEAHAACQITVQWLIATWPARGTPTCTVYKPLPDFGCTWTAQQAPHFPAYHHSFPCSAACDQQPAMPSAEGAYDWWTGPLPEGEACIDGCAYEASRPTDITYQSCIADESGTTTQCWHLARYTPTGNVCTSSDPPAPQSPGVTCNADLTACQDDDGEPYVCLASGGSLTCVPLAPPPPDGTVDPPETPPGQGPEGEGDTNTPTTGSVTGGGTCDQPLQCSGDVIQCAQLWQTWRARCAVEGYGTSASGFGADCSQPAQCNGPPLECYKLFELKRLRCAQGDGNLLRDAIAGDFAGRDLGTQRQLTDVWMQDGDSAELDTSGWGWSRSCPTLPTVSVFGTSISFDAVASPVICDWLGIGRGLVLLFASLVCLRILAGGIN